jgi:hypothetical protein
VFSTWLYTGNGATQTITNGINLSANGGLVWTKARYYGISHRLVDTARGPYYELVSNDTSASSYNGQGLTSFGTTGYSIDAGGGYNNSGGTYVSWTFRKQPKFFDVVTWTGDGTANRAIPHNLGSQPGFITCKKTSGVDAWQTAHRGNGTTGIYGFALNDAAQGYSWSDYNTYITSTVFYPDQLAGFMNTNGQTYVAYLFAHNAGGFGPTGTDNVISCGSFTTDGSGNASVTLGYEPQWVMYKRTNAASNWVISDVMRGSSLTTYAQLYADSSGAEDSGAGPFGMIPNATGFNPTGILTSSTYIYIAIRRGPMKVPTDATKVFYPNAVAQTDTPDSSNVPFPPDLVNTFSRNGTDRTVIYDTFNFVDRLRGLGVPNNSFNLGGRTLVASSTNAEDTSAGGGYVQLKADSQNITRGSGWNSATYGSWIYYFFRRAPGFFDVVCYTGGKGGAITVNHNLTVVPELVIFKNRSAAANWLVGLLTLSFGGTNYAALLNSSNPRFATGVFPSAPTATTLTIGTGIETNDYFNPYTYVAYLFATCPGVSKVGSYTGNGTTQAIACGFTGGARFVLIKATSTTGNWLTFDTARGMTVLTDPVLSLNSTAAETATLGACTTTTGGFTVNEAILAGVNTSGVSFVFLAIA